MKTIISPEMEKSVIVFYFAGKPTLREVAKHFAIAQTTVFNILKRNNIQTRSATKINDGDLEQFFTDYHNLSNKQVAQKYNVSIGSIKQYLDRFDRERKDKRTYIVDDRFFEKMDEAQYWFMGWVWSDGCNEPERSTVRVSAHIKDIELINKFHSFLGGTFYQCSNKNMVEFRICSGPISKQLNTWGCVKAKSLIIEYPNIPVNDRIFIRGILEGDGWISYKHTNSLDVGISCGSPKFLERLIEILNNMNIPTRLRVKGKESRCYGVSRSIQIAGPCINKVKFLNWIYKDATYYLDRKYKKYTDFMDNNPQFSREIYPDNCVF